MTFHPSERLTDEQVNKGLKYVIGDGLATEAMVTLTSGAFLVAMALSMGASNFQIGLLAALPTIANLFQLAAIWLVQKFQNRKLITVLSVLTARFPLLLIGIMPLIFSGGASVVALITLLAVQYFFGSIAGTSWNSWMRDVVPVDQLGSFFSKRSRLAQILNVTMSLAVAISIDYIKVHFPHYEIQAYCAMFIIGGIFGMLSAYLLSLTPEPKTNLSTENIFKLYKRPLKDMNYRKLLVFNSVWAFALNIATPFFSVFLLKKLDMNLSYIIGLNILSQITSILFIRVWGRNSDRFSNKTILNICAPIYIACFFAWTFTTMPGPHMFTIPLLVLIHIFSGIATSGINLAMGNIAMKLAPKNEAIVYISARSLVTAIVASIAPIIGGLLADFFTSHQLVWNIEWAGPNGSSIFHLIELQQWDFFFVLGGILALFSLRFLRKVKEDGEVHKSIVLKEMAVTFKNSLREKTGNAHKTVLKSLSFIPSVNKKMINKLDTMNNRFGDQVVWIIEKQMQDVNNAVLSVRNGKTRKKVQLNVKEEDLVLIED